MTSLTLGVFCSQIALQFERKIQALFKKTKTPKHHKPHKFEHAFHYKKFILNFLQAFLFTVESQKTNTPCVGGTLLVCITQVPNPIILQHTTVPSISTSIIA